MATRLAFSAAGVMALTLSSHALAGGGTISGKINFEGTMAQPKMVRVQGDQYCVDAHKDKPIPEERFVFNYEKKTLCNVFVYVSSPVAGAFTAPSTSVEIDQVGCQYTPHVVGVMVGQKMAFKNNDSTAHNLKLVPEINPGFNEGQPQAGMVKEVSFAKKELGMPLKCDVHAWMNAYIHVLDNPFFAVSDANGEYKIEGLPAGTYEVTVWHEFDKFKPTAEKMTVTVEEGKTATADFTYQPPQKSGG